METMVKTVALSATLRQIAGARQIDVTLPPDAVVRDLFAALADVAPALADFALTPSREALKPGVQLVIDGRHVDFLQGLDTPLAPAQQIFLIPPLMGG